MLSGVLTSDNLTEAFRSLSQKRRHGVFEVSSEAGQVEILFHNGRIIGARKVEESLPLAICLRLINGKRLKREVAQQLMSRAADIAELKVELVDSGYVSEEDFELAKESCEMDLLYSLRDNSESGFFKFHSKMVAPNEENSLCVPPTKLLLDLVELDVDEERFKEVFGELDSDTLLACEASVNPEFSLEERLIWTCLDVTDSLSEVCKMTLLSEFQLKESLLSMHDRGLISVKRARTGSLSSLGVACIDDELGSGNWGVTDEVDNLTLSETDSLSTVIEHAADLLEGTDDLGLGDSGDTNGFSVGKSQLKSAEGLEPEVESSFEAEQSVEEEIDTDTAGVLLDEDFFDEELEIGLDRAPESAILSAISETNISLLSESRAREAAMIVVCIGLVVLAVYAPTMIEQWFVALSNFSSVGDFPVIQ